MRRRDFIRLVGTAATWPIAARAQQKSEIPRVGFVYQGSQAAMANRLEGVLSGLRDSGYAAPAQVEIVARAAEGDPARIAPLVAEVIAKNASVIMASGPLVLNAARSATRTIPIVAIDLETDPVTSGVAATLARPGGNITGVFLDFPDFTAKWMEILIECNPKLSRAAVSAFGGKSDMTLCESPLLGSLLGAKRTCRFALHMSASDTKRTLWQFGPSER